MATLGASKYAYAEATWTQTLPDWIGSHIRMLEFFGSVPSLWIPDNLKAAIKQGLSLRAGGDLDLPGLREPLWCGDLAGASLPRQG